MVYKITTSNHPSQVYSVNAGGQDVLFRLKWNVATSGGFWTFTLMNSYGDIMSAGRRIKSGVFVLPDFIDGFFGNFIAFPISAPEEKLGLTPWGSTHSIYYDGGADG